MPTWAAAIRLTNRTPIASTATTAGLAAVILQDQDVDQTNFNGQLALATSIVGSGDVTVSNKGKTEAKEDGIEAVSNATSGATINNTVTQTNTNNLSGSTEGALALLTQDQGVEQVNLNGQIEAATSIATSGNVTVSNEGDTKAKEDGIKAKSSAEAGASIVNNVDSDQ